ncbi:shieldin complex subunit 2 [Petromyzon marinus]|uniref:shieldin complex subunit 2 n=1 Tax=Petromyzon marinus TaxID=7757 RepID=UPI003F72706D
MSGSRRVRRVHVFVGAPIVNPDCCDMRNNVPGSSRPPTGFQEFLCTWQKSTSQLLLKCTSSGSGGGDGRIPMSASTAGSDATEQRVDRDWEDESEPCVMDGSQELFDLQPSLQEYIDSTLPGPCDDLTLGSAAAGNHHKWFTNPSARTLQASGILASQSSADDYSQVTFPSLLTQQPPLVAASASDRLLSPPSLAKWNEEPGGGGGAGTVCEEYRRGHPSGRDVAFKRGLGADAAELGRTSCSFGLEELSFEAFGSGVLCSQVVPPTPVALAKRGGKAARLKQHFVRKRKLEQEVRGHGKALRGENNKLATCENEKDASVILSGNEKCEVEASHPLTQSPSIVETKYAMGGAGEIISENPQTPMLPLPEINECELASQADWVEEAVSATDPKTERPRDGDDSEARAPAPIVSDLGRLLQRQQQQQQRQERAARTRRGDPQMRAVHTTPLAECTGGGGRGGPGSGSGRGGSFGAKRRNVLVAVLACLPVRDVRVKRGASAGRSVPVAGVVATDQSLASARVVMWRLAAFWALLLTPGDVVMLTDVCPHMDTWRQEEVLQLSPASRMLKLGLWPLVQASHWREVVDVRKLDALLRHLSERHPHLGVVGPRLGLAHTSSVRYRDPRTSEPDSILHCAGRVTGVVTRTEWDPYTLNGRAQAGYGRLVATARLQQSSRVEHTLQLTGQAASWAGHIRRAPLDTIWAFHYLVVRKDPAVATEIELWSTPLSSCERLFPDDPRAALCADLVPEGAVARPSSLAGLLAAHITGRVEVTARVASLLFLRAGRPPRGRQPGGQAERPGDGGGGTRPAGLRVDATTPLVAVAAALPGLLLRGCAGCGRELWEDALGVVAPCLPCAPRATRLFYPPAVLCVTDGVERVEVHVSPRTVEKLLLNIPPSWLHRPAGYGLTFSDLVADLCSALVRGTERFRLLLASLSECDENDVETRRSLTLLHLSLDTTLLPP